MFHFPVNHPLAGFYRGIAVFAAIAMVVFPLALGGSGALLAVMAVLAVPVLLGVFVGRSRYHYLFEIVGAALILLGIAGLLVLHSDYNYLDLSVSSCVVLFVLGPVLLTVGGYTKAGSDEQAEAEDAYRHASQGRVAEAAKAVSAPHTHAEEFS
jgi:hypothetical protein